MVNVVLANFIFFYLVSFISVFIFFLYRFLVYLFCLSILTYLFSCVFSTCTFPFGITTRCNVVQYSLLLSTFYMFQVVFPPIIRSSNCTHSIWYMSSFLAATASVGELALVLAPDAVC